MILRSKLLILVTCVITLIAAIPMSFAYYPPPTGYFVNDYGNVIPEANENQMESDLYDFEQKTSNEIVVVTMRKLDDGIDPFTYSQKLFSDWKIGKADKNNGVLLFVETYTGKFYINVGKGLEGVLPDSLAGTIIRGDILPRLAENDDVYATMVNGDQNYLAAIYYGVNKIMDVTKDEYVNTTPGSPKSVSFDDTKIGKVVAVVVGIPLFVGKVLGFDVSFFFNSGFWLWVFGIIIGLYLVTLIGKTKTFWLGGMLGAASGLMWGLGNLTGAAIVLPVILLGPLGLLFDYLCSRFYKQSSLNESFALAGPILLIFAIFSGILGGFDGDSGGGSGSSEGFGGGSSGGGGAGSH